jgi:hypothetical protein
MVHNNGDNVGASFKDVVLSVPWPRLATSKVCHRNG